MKHEVTSWTSLIESLPSTIERRTSPACLVCVSECKSRVQNSTANVVGVSILCHIEVQDLLQHFFLSIFGGNGNKARIPDNANKCQ